MHRHDRLLVSGSDLDAVRGKYPEFFRIRSHVPARFVAAVLVVVPEGAAVSVHGVLPGGDFSGEDSRSRADRRPPGRTRVGTLFCAAVGGAVSVGAPAL